MGWNVIVIWECELKKAVAAVNMNKVIESIINVSNLGVNNKEFI